MASKRASTLDLSKLKDELPDLSLDIALRYSGFLNTNYIPSQSQVDEIRTFTSAITSRTEEVASEIAQLQAQLANLRKRQSILKDAVAPFKALVSPFRRFPPELMQYIFMSCLPETRNAVMHSSEAPVLLGRVCSQWRRISLNTPALWSTLHIVPPKFNADAPELNKVRFQRKRDVVDTWLRRSGACPLSISLVWFGSDGEAETRLCGELLSLLVPLSKRWRRIEFQMPLRMCKPFTAIGQNDVPLLETLSLTDNRSNYEDFDSQTLGQGAADVPIAVWPEHLLFVAEATSLKNLNLTFFTGAIRIPSSIPWEQLTTLYLESNVSFFFQDCRELLQTLERCTSLQRCTLKLPLSMSALPIPAQQSTGHGYKPVNCIITLPELTYLCVDGDQNLLGSFHMTTVLSNIRAPKLKELAIYGRSGRPEQFDDNDSDSDSEAEGEVQGLDLQGSIPNGAAVPLAIPPTSGESTRSSATPSHEPIIGLKKLLQQSSCSLEKLRLESVSILEKDIVACMRLVPTLKELVMRDYGARIGFSPIHIRRDSLGDKTCVEDRILKALTVERGWNSTPASMVSAREERREEDGGQVLASMPASPATSSWTMVEDSEESHSDGSVGSAPPSPVSQPTDVPEPASSFELSHEKVRARLIQQELLLPNLVDIEFAVSFGSQDTFCRFVESRFLPDFMPEPEMYQADEHLYELRSDENHQLAPPFPPFPTAPTPSNDARFPLQPTPGEADAPSPFSVARLKSVKCTFTAQERPDVKARLQRMEQMGLEAAVVFQTPLPEEYMPSPWMGVESM